MTGQLTPDILLSAYRAGIFPMAESATDESIFWVDPKYRGIMPLNNFHVSKSLRRAILKLDYQISVNTSFKEVINRPIKKVPTLRDITIANLFFENSTRTKISFELAQKRLGADVVNFSSSSSSVKKGESLTDTVNNILAMKVDMIVIRHPLSLIHI